MSSYTEQLERDNERLRKDLELLHLLQDENGDLKDTLRVYEELKKKMIVERAAFNINGNVYVYVDEHPELFKLRKRVAS